MDQRRWWRYILLSLAGSQLYNVDEVTTNGFLWELIIILDLDEKLNGNYYEMRGINRFAKCSNIKHYGLREKWVELEGQEHANWVILWFGYYVCLQLDFNLSRFIFLFPYTLLCYILILYSSITSHWRPTKRVMLIMCPLLLVLTTNGFQFNYDVSPYYQHKLNISFNNHFNIFHRHSPPAPCLFFAIISAQH